MKSSEKKRTGTPIRSFLREHPYAPLAEILLIFGFALLVIELLKPLAQENLWLRQTIIFIMNIAMIALVWLGQKLRGEDFRDLGLKGLPKTPGKIAKTILWSLLVFVLALVAFVLGAALMNLLGFSNPPADMSGYDYLKNNPGAFALSLLGVYVVSSFGEEYVYRAFLIERLLRLFAKNSFKKVYAIAISAIVFGLAHYSWGLTGVVQTFFMGLVLALFYFVLGRRLPALILSHIYMDTLLLLSIYFN